MKNNWTTPEIYTLEVAETAISTEGGSNIDGHIYDTPDNSGNIVKDLFS